ncbi:MAG: uracil-DNA glycosylase [Micrococcaceae bacterium]|nr:uracil-DNA glycosylase [Micrococcaceae bacterium]
METAAEHTPWPMAPDWAAALAPEMPRLQKLDAELSARRDAGEQVLPAGDHLLRAFHRPLADVKVLILGQDPYPTPGHSTGLAFAVDASVDPLPRSLKNIFTEYCQDTGYPFPASGDLTPWAEQGVLLLNPILSVAAGDAGSHRKLGWQEFTTAAITALVSRRAPLVSILGGRHAQGFEPLLGSTPGITSAHPSPLSARRGFFGSRPFSRANELLTAQGAAPVQWRLPGAEGGRGGSGAGAPDTEVTEPLPGL